MNILRLICIENDIGAAANVGGPVETRHKTFDMPCPPEVTEWLNGSTQWKLRSIQGVEVRGDEAKQ